MARPSKNRPIIWHNGAIQTCIFLGERLMSSTIDRLAGKSALTPLGNEINGESLAQRIAELGEWFHNLDLHGVHTAPYHFLGDRKSTRLNSSHRCISYAVFCLCSSPRSLHSFPTRRSSDLLHLFGRTSYVLHHRSPGWQVSPHSSRQ